MCSSDLSHADHVLGLDDTRVFTMDGRVLPIFCDETTAGDLRRIFAYAFLDDPDEYWVPSWDLRTVRSGEPLEFAGLSFTSFVAPHGRFDVRIWRVHAPDGTRLFAFATDVSDVSDDVARELRGVKLLVLDLLRDRPHEKHLTREQAVEAARRIGAEAVRFVHVTHDLFHARTNAELPARMRLAYDGEVFRIPADG